MKRVLLFFSSALFCLPVFAQDGRVPADNKSQGVSADKKLEIWEDIESVPKIQELDFLKLDEPPLELGHTGDAVRELQATLNKRLTGGERETTSQRSHWVWVRPPAGYTENHVIDVVDPWRRFLPLQIRGDWQPLDEDGIDIKPGKAGEEDSQKYWKQAYGFRLPAHPLKVDGVFGQRTYAAVMLFQMRENLPTTGEVDAVTLDKLEPMVPTNRLLAVIMNSVDSFELLGKSDSRPRLVKTLTAVIMTLIIVLASAFVYQIARNLAQSTRFLSRWLFTPSTSPWFNTMREKRVFLHMAQFAPAIFIYCGAIAVFPPPESSPMFASAESIQAFPYLNVFQDWHLFVSRLGLAYAALVFVLVSLSFADACDAILSPDQGTDNPISGIVRAAKRAVTLAGLLLIVAALVGVSPWRIIGGFGAFTAVILLVFRDYLLGLVASVQIIANKMVQIGDWIEMPKHEANGDVNAISLSVIKVQNFDKTVSTIPTHALLSESFRNWSEMHRAGCRRIKRAIYVDMHSIQACTPEMIEHFERMELIRDYVKQKLQDLVDYNAEHDTVGSSVNSRRLTNIGTFRAYLEAYLKQHPGLNDELTVLVRHLQPTEKGLPIEIYTYCSETQWKEYEAVQADIFDHVLAILPDFSLRAFQVESDIVVDSEGHSQSVELKKKFEEARQYVNEQNRHLIGHPNTRVNAAVRRVEKKLSELGIDSDAIVDSSERTLVLAWRNGPP